MPTHWPADPAGLTQASEHVAAAEGSRWDGADKSRAPSHAMVAGSARDAGINQDQVTRAGVSLAASERVADSSGNGLQQVALAGKSEDDCFLPLADARGGGQGAAEEWEAAAAAAAAGVAVVAPGEWDMKHKKDGERTEEPRRRQRLAGWLALLHAQKAANAMAESSESAQTGDAAWDAKCTSVNLLQTQGLDPKVVNGVTAAALQPLGAVSQEASLRLGNVGACVGGVKGTEGLQGSLLGLPATGYVGQLGGVLGLGSQQPMLPAQQQMQSLALPTPYTFGVIDPIGMANLPIASLPLAGFPVPTLATSVQMSSEAVLNHAAPGLAIGSQQALAAASIQHQASLPNLAVSLPLPLSEQVPHRQACRSGVCDAMSV